MSDSSLVKYHGPDHGPLGQSNACGQLKQARALCAARQGRLIFGLDLTGSREASLHKARQATAAMLDAVKSVGAVGVKLLYYRGDDECRASQWHDDSGVLDKCMRRLTCETGFTQIARMLRFVLTEKEPISSLVFVGDHFDEDSDEVTALAARLGARGIPIFVFHESSDADYRALAAKPVFRRVAEISGGVYCELKSDSGDVLRELLTHVAAFSTAGRAGLRQIEGPKTPEAEQLQERLLIGPTSSVKGGK
jgi:hypothetical protein